MKYFPLGNVFYKNETTKKNDRVTFVMAIANSFFLFWGAGGGVGNVLGGADWIVSGFLFHLVKNFLMGKCIAFVDMQKLSNVQITLKEVNLNFSLIKVNIWTKPIQTLVKTKERASFYQNKLAAITVKLIQVVQKQFEVN